MEWMSNCDSTAGNKLINEYDCGDNQQEMDQISTYAADQPQQPEHDKQGDYCPQHYSLLLIISNTFRLYQHQRVQSRTVEEVQGLCRAVIDPSQVQCPGSMPRFNAQVQCMCRRLIMIRRTDVAG